MKKKSIRKYLRHADDYVEEMERKIKRIEKTLFFVSLGMEYFYGKEDCMEVNMIQLVQDYLKTMKKEEMAGLHEVLEKLKEV